MLPAVHIKKYICFVCFFNVYPFLYSDILIKAMYQQMVGVPVTVCIPQFQKQCSSTSKKLQRHQVAVYEDFKA